MQTASPPETTPTTERVLGRLRGSAPGPLLIVVAALHGNEPAGVEGVRRVLARLDGGDPALRGDFVALLGNRQAFARGVRFVAEDLHRVWLPERLRRVRAATGPLAAEDEELRQLDVVLRATLERMRGPLYALDLHTTSGPGPAFAVVDDTLTNREFALSLPVPMVLGLEEELDGLLVHHLLDDYGAVTLGFESGQHGEPAAVDRAEAAVWVALETPGVLSAGARPEPAMAARLLADASGPLPRVTEVRHRHAIVPDDEFRMERGFASFQPVAAGQVLGHDRRGEVRARESGRVLMPLYQPQGDDGFFLIRRVRPFWLRLSRRMRRLGLDRLVHWLPGVRRDPARPGAYLVDRRVARWFALEIFHLLGYRRHGRVGRRLSVSRRADDGG
jgi:succinylglutamate desuccinylase